MFYNENDEKQENNEVIDSINESAVNETENLESEPEEKDTTLVDSSDTNMTNISDSNENTQNEVEISNTISLNYLNPEITIIADDSLNEESKLKLNSFFNTEKIE